MISFSELRDESNRVGAEFLFIEIDTAYIFLEVADATKLLETRERNHKNARIPYDTVIRHTPDVALTPDQQIDLCTLTAKLRLVLEAAGSIF